MTKLTQTKRLTLAAIAALTLTAVTSVAVLAGTCTTPTPDCPEENCDK